LTSTNGLGLSLRKMKQNSDTSHDSSESDDAERQSKSGSEPVVWGLDKETFLQMMRHVAAQERTVLEFKTRERDGRRVLDHVMDITEHVSALEEQQ
jgi:hypothetical protein